MTAGPAGSAGHMAAKQFRELVGLDVEPVGDGRARVRLMAREQHLNPHGTVHGGVLATIADVAAGEAIAAGSPDGLGVTIELKVTFLKPGRKGELVAEAAVIKRGKQITVVVTEVSQAGDLIAHAIGTFTSGS